MCVLLSQSSGIPWMDVGKVPGRYVLLAVALCLFGLSFWMYDRGVGV